MVLVSAENFPGRKERTSYWIACLNSRLGRSDEAIKTLQIALSNGYWWSSQGLLSDSDLDPLRDLDEFKAILARCDQRQREAQASSRPELLVQTPPDFSVTRPHPLMISLHPRGSNARDNASSWQPALASGLVLAVPQSSQPFGWESFCWDDQKLAEKEVTSAYAQVLASYAVDRDRVILAGFSQGGELAILLALKNSIPCRGFIAVAPSIRRLENMATRLGVPATRKIRGFLVSGEKDSRYSRTRKLYEELVKSGAVCQFSANPDRGHEYPDDFEAELTRALNFVLG